MTGAKEVPPVKTMATGTASFLNNQTVIDYDLSVSDLYNATACSYTSGKGRSERTYCGNLIQDIGSITWSFWWIFR